MKAFFIFFITVTLVFGTGTRSLFSPIPAPQNFFLDVEGSVCNEACLATLVEQELYFSFLSKYPYATVSLDALQELYAQLSITFGLDAQGDKPAITLAVLVPQKRIRGYAMSTVNTVIAYLLHRNHHFTLEVFNINDETPEDVARGMAEIRAKGHRYVIAPLTIDGVPHLLRHAEGIHIFVPTVHKSLVQGSTGSVLFGGIDYQDQIRTLSLLANEKVATFSDGTLLGQTLDGFVEQESGTVIYKRELSSARIDFKSFLDKNTRLQNSSVFLNMPLVRSSLLASQFRAFGIEPHVLLSTQISYHPMLLTLSQFEDREKLFIANSIDFVPADIRIINTLLGHNIEYDWVNYATSVGMDYFYTQFFNKDAITLFKEHLHQGQVQYKTRLFKAGRYKFFLAE